MAFLSRQAPAIYFSYSVNAPHVWANPIRLSHDLGQTHESRSIPLETYDPGKQLKVETLYVVHWPLQTEATSRTRLPLDFPSESSSLQARNALTAAGAIPMPPFLSYLPRERASF